MKIQSKQKATLPATPPFPSPGCFKKADEDSFSKSPSAPQSAENLWRGRLIGGLACGAAAGIGACLAQNPSWAGPALLAEGMATFMFGMVGSHEGAPYQDYSNYGNAWMNMITPELSHDESPAMAPSFLLATLSTLSGAVGTMVGGTGGTAVGVALAAGIGALVAPFYPFDEDNFRSKPQPQPK